MKVTPQRGLPGLRGQGRAGESVQAPPGKRTAVRSSRGGPAPGETGTGKYNMGKQRGQQRPGPALREGQVPSGCNRCAEQVGISGRGVFRSSPARVHRCPARARPPCAPCAPRPPQEPGGQVAAQPQEVEFIPGDLKHKQFSLVSGAAGGQRVGLFKTDGPSRWSAVADRRFSSGQRHVP